MTDPAVLANTIVTRDTKKSAWEKHLAESVPSGLLQVNWEWDEQDLDKVHFVPQGWDDETAGMVEKAMTDLSTHATEIGMQAKHNPMSAEVRRRVAEMDTVVESIESCTALTSAAVDPDYRPLVSLRTDLNDQFDKIFCPRVKRVKMRDSGYPDRTAAAWSREFNKNQLQARKSRAREITELEEADLNFRILNLAMEEERLAEYRGKRGEAE